MCGPNGSLLMGKLGVAGFLPNYTVLGVGSMARVCLNLSGFENSVFLVAQCAEVIHLVSGFLSEEVVPCVGVYSVSPWEEGNSGASYVTILVQKPFQIHDF